MIHELCVYGDRPLIIGATGMDALLQNIRIILQTGRCSVPLDRGFACLHDMVDSPAPHVTALLSARLIEAIEKYEPRIKVQSLTFEAAENGRGMLMQGRLTPKIRFSLREGVKL